MTSGQDGPTFSLRLIKASGKDIGRQVFLARCRYGKKSGPTPKPRSTRKTDADSPETLAKRAHVDNGTIPITDVEKNRYISPLISHIVGYNQYKVIH